MKARCYTIWIKWKSWVPDRLSYSCVLHYKTKPILVLYTRGSSVVLYISIHRTAVRILPYQCPSEGQQLCIKVCSQSHAE